jgi:hypothetical protein
MIWVSVGHTAEQNSSSFIELFIPALSTIPLYHARGSVEAEFHGITRRSPARRIDRGPLNENVWQSGIVLVLHRDGTTHQLVCYLYLLQVLYTRRLA